MDMEIPTNDELESFIKKIDQIENVIKGLSSENELQVQESLEKADYLIKESKNEDETETEGIKTKTGVNRSVINKCTENDTKDPVINTNNMNQEAFITMMEKDANERYERKKLNTKLANELKDKGNLEFKNKNYEKAIEFYTEALQKVRDIPAIYTNRAQAYIILGKYSEAISDCDWALRVDEKCTKAIIHKAKALSHLKEFDKAHKEFENAKSIDSKQSSLIDDYIKEMERLRLAHNQDESAKIFLKNSTDDLVDTFLDILEIKLNVKEQNIWYYSGGFRCLASICNTDTLKTLFRTQNGFKILQEHEILKNYLIENINLKNLNSSEIEFLSSFFDLVDKVCQENDENIRSFFKLNNISSIVENLIVQLNSNKKQFKNLKFEILKILFNFSQNEFGRVQLINNLDQTNLIKHLIEFDKDIKTKQKSLSIIQNFLFDAKFQNKLKLDDLKLLIEQFCNLLKSQNNVNSNTENFISLIVTCIYSLTDQKIFLNYISTCEPIWLQCVKLLEQVDIQKENLDTLVNVLMSLLINMCSSKTEFLEKYSQKIIENVLDKYNKSQVLILIGNIIQNSKDRNKILAILNENFISNLINNINAKILISQSLKILALCTQNGNLSFRKQLVDKDKSLSFLYDIFRDVSQSTINEADKNKNFNVKKLNEVVISNAVLCLSYCIESDQNSVQQLTKTNIVMDLLYLTRDGFNIDMQKNCGILLAKLAKKDQKHLERLRELNGIEILYSSLKNANI